MNDDSYWILRSTIIILYKLERSIMIELKDICFTRDGKKILNHINLTLEDDKFYVITGPNGSGKSTLAKIIMGIQKPDAGQILFHGEDI